MLQCKGREFRRLQMASSKFLRRQAEKCADLASRTVDQDERQRWERLQRVYCHLADTEEQQASELNSASGDTENRPSA